MRIEFSPDSSLVPMDHSGQSFLPFFWHATLRAWDRVTKSWNFSPREGFLAVPYFPTSASMHVAFLATKIVDQLGAGLSDECLARKDRFGPSGGYTLPGTTLIGVPSIKATKTDIRTDAEGCLQRKVTVHMHGRSHDKSFIEISTMIGPPKGLMSAKAAGRLSASLVTAIFVPRISCWLYCEESIKKSQTTRPHLGHESPE